MSSQMRHGATWLSTQTWNHNCEREIGLIASMLWIVSINLINDFMNEDNTFRHTWRVRLSETIHRNNITTYWQIFLFLWISIFYCFMLARRSDFSGAGFGHAPEFGISQQLSARRLINAAKSPWKILPGETLSTILGNFDRLVTLTSDAQLREARCLWTLFIYN